MTSTAEAFVEWTSANASYRDLPEWTISEFAAVVTATYTPVQEGSPTGTERRWDREVQDVYRFGDGSLALARYWQPLQYDHADGVEPDAVWYVAEERTRTVSYFERRGLD